MRLLGFSPSRSWVEIDDMSLLTRMGWAFHLDVARTRIRRAQRERKRVWSWGVRRWRGRWLVNGSSSGIVRIDFAPPVQGRVGPTPVLVRELHLSVQDPEGLVAAIGP
jgi:hypothetical protein